MRSQRQGIRSTKAEAPVRETSDKHNINGNDSDGGAAQIEDAAAPTEEKKDILTTIHKPCNIYTQTRQDSSPTSQVRAIIIK